MSRSARADFTCRQLQIVKSNAYEFEPGQWVVLFPPMAAFPLQLTLNSVPVDEEIMTTPGHSSIAAPKGRGRRLFRRDARRCWPWARKTP
jgi:hypothetical protein